MRIAAATTNVSASLSLRLASLLTTANYHRSIDGWRWSGGECYKRWNSSVERITPIHCCFSPRVVSARCLRKPLLRWRTTRCRDLRCLIWPLRQACIIDFLVISVVPERNRNYFLDTIPSQPWCQCWAWRELCGMLRDIGTISMMLEVVKGGGKDRVRDSQSGSSICQDKTAKLCECFIKPRRWEMRSRAYVLCLGPQALISQNLQHLGALT